MFKALKNKLKSWFSSSSKKAEKPEKKARFSKPAKPIKEKQIKNIDTKKLEETKKQLISKEQTKAQEQPVKKGIFAKIREKFRFKITQDYFNQIWDDLELILLENNVSVKAIDEIKTNLEQTLIEKEIEKSNLEQTIKQALKQAIEALLIEPFDLIEKISQHKQKSNKPFVILLVGINGSGKTTTLAKLANLLKSKNLSCVLAAADTFRAASIEQLSLHAEKLQVPIIKHEYGSDPASVGFDAIKYAEKNKIDVVLVDTAGRMHTKTDLIREMEKICRVTNPDLKIFIGESITGNDATEQADVFNQAINIDAIILTKADVDEKGGTAISVSKVTNKPILYLGLGQNYEDLIKFDKNKLIKSLGL